MIGSCGPQSTLPWVHGPDQATYPTLLLTRKLYIACRLQTCQAPDLSQLITSSVQGSCYFRPPGCTGLDGDYGPWLRHCGRDVDYYWEWGNDDQESASSRQRYTSQEPGYINSYFHPHTTYTYTSNYPSHESTGMPTTVNGTESGSAGVSDPKCTTCRPEALATVSPSSARTMSALFGSSTNVQLPRVPVMLIRVLVKSSFAPIVFHIQMGSLMLGWLCTLAAAW